MINLKKNKISRKAVYLAVYLFFLLFFTLFGNIGFSALNQMVLWLFGPLLAIYILEPNLYRIHNIPSEYYLYLSLIVFALLGFINVEQSEPFFRYLKVMVSNFVLMVVLFYGINSVAEWKLAWITIVITSVVVSFLAFFLDVPTAENEEYFRLSGLVGNANGLGNYARIGVLASLILLQFATKPGLKLFYWLTIIFLSYTIILTASRGNFANLLFVLGTYLIFKYFRGWKIILLVLALFTVGNIILAYSEQFLQGFYLFDRLSKDNSIGSVMDNEMRAKLYLLAWNTFLDHPFLGIGLNQFQFFSGGHITHTDILDIFVQLGMFAGVIYISIYVKVFIKIWKLRYALLIKRDKDIFHLLIILFSSEMLYGTSNANWFSQFNMSILSLIIIYITKIRTTRPQFNVVQSTAAKR